MIRGEEDIFADLVPRAVDEPRLGTRPRRAGLGEYLQARLERQAAQRDQHARSGKQSRLLDQVLAAIGELLRERAVVRRGALDRRSQPRAEELEPVSRSNRFRPVRESDRVERAEEKVPRLVTGENAAGPVAPVRRRREADDQEMGARVSEGGQRTAPVGLAPEAPRRSAGRFLSPRDETGTTAAGNDLAFKPAIAGLAVAQRREYFPVSFPSASMCPRTAASNCAFVAPAASVTSESSAYTVKT